MAQKKNECKIIWDTSHCTWMRDKIILSGLIVKSPSYEISDLPKRRAQY